MRSVSRTTFSNQHAWKATLAHKNTSFDLKQRTRVVARCLSNRFERKAASCFQIPELQQKKTIRQSGEAKAIGTTRIP
jgi:hypothetical protein